LRPSPRVRLPSPAGAGEGMGEREGAGNPRLAPWASAPESASGWRGESPLQVNVTCNRLQLRRGDTGWGAAGGERPVRTIRNSIRPVRCGEPASEWRSPEFPLGEEPVVGWNLGAIRRWVACPDERQHPQVVGDGMVRRP